LALSPEQGLREVLNAAHLPVLRRKTLEANQELKKVDSRSLEGAGQVSLVVGGDFSRTLSQSVVEGEHGELMAEMTDRQRQLQDAGL